MSVSLDDFEVEADFEAELAKVKLEESGSGQCGPEPHDHALTDVYSSDTDDGDDYSERCEPASLQLLRMAIERRDRAAEEFSRDWQRFCLEAAASEHSTAAPQRASNTNPTTRPDIDASPCSSPSGPFCITTEAIQGEVEAGVRRRRPASIAADRQSGGGQLPGADRASVPLSRSSDGAASGLATEGHELCSDAPVSCKAAHKQMGQRVATAPAGSIGVIQCPISGAARPGPDGPVLSKNSTVVGIEIVAANEARRKREEELEDERRRALEELDKELVRTTAERQAEIAAAAAEQGRLAAEIEAVYQRLELAKRDAAEREVLREATMAALQREALNLARQRMAGWLIGRAWRRYRQGPMRAARLAAAVCIQAAWRGHLDRRRVAQLRAQRAILHAVEEAAREGKAEVLRSAVSRAHEMGLGDDVRMRLAAVDAAVDDAAASLKAAASTGTYSEYRTALAAAQAFPNLEPLIAESSALFEERRTKAEAAVWAAVADEPMPSFYRLLESVAPLGIQPQRLTAAVEAVRQRDEQLITKLAAASRAQGAAFDAAGFEELAEHALRLGLKGDAAAARLVVERRRRSLAAALRTQGAALSDGAECLRIAEEARRMGMTAEAESLMQQLTARQGDVQAALRLAVAEGSVARVVLFLQHATKLHVSAAILQDFSRILRDRQSALAQALADATACASLHGFLAVRGARVHGGTDLVELLAADRALGMKRGAAVSLLSKAVVAICGILEEAPSLGEYALAEDLARVMRLGSARAVLKHAVERDTPASSRVATKPAETTAARELQLQAGRRQRLRQQTAVTGMDDPVPRPGRASLSPEAQHATLTVHPHEWLVALRNSPPDFSGLLKFGKSGALGSSAVDGALLAGWPCLASVALLGLSDAACLAMCALDLHHVVRLATGSHALRVAVVGRDYWGVLLPLPELAGGTHAALRASATARASCITALDVRGREKVSKDEFLEGVFSLLRRQRGVSTVRPWAPPPNVLAVTPLPPSDRPAADNRAALLDTSAPASSCSSWTGPPCRGLPASSAAPGPDSLTLAIILRMVPEAARGPCVAGSACLPNLFRLDLDLERLTSLKGLDSLCPSLRVLSADANRLSSLEGLGGLAGLRELSLRQNQLASLMRLEGSQALPALPQGRCLRQLALDSNKLSGQLSGLRGCCGLRSLSLADNALTDMGAELESSAAVLTSLCLRGNYLTSLRAQLVSLTVLRELDVSGNRLTSLEGIQGLLMLQTLHASGNTITALPGPLCLPHLTSLDLARNALTAFPDLGGSSAGADIALPALRRLVLTENKISLLGPFGSMPHLTSLDLSLNNLASLDALHAMAHLTGLCKLNIGSNPMTDPMPLGARSWGRLRLGAASASGASWTGEGSPLASATEWAFPALRELDYDEIGPLERLAGAMRTAAGSPACAVAGTRQLRAAGACYVVHHTHAPGVASAGFGRQPRAVSNVLPPAGGRRSWRPQLRFPGDLEAPVDPVSVQGALAAGAGSAFGSAALCGLHAELAVPVRAGLGRSASDVFGAQLQYNTRATAAVTSKWQSQPAALKWLSRVGRVWNASGPSEMLELHARQLAFAQCMGLQDGNTPVASADAAPCVRLLEAAGGDIPCHSTAVAVLQHGKADLVDFEAIRCFRPAARFVQCLASASASSGAPGSAAIVDGAGMQLAQQLAEGRASGGAAVWTVGAEAQGRLEACAAQAGHQLVEELKLRLRGRGGGPTGGSRMASPREPQPLITARPSYVLGRMLQDTSVAATSIQAFWRGLRVRRSVPQLAVRARDETVSRRAAATTIQAWWRGYCVRRARLLPALRRAEEARQAESRRREAAAITIQAHVRGHLTRKQLRAALAAVRLPPGSTKDPDLQLMDSGELDDMLQGLQGLMSPIEELLGGEELSRSRLATTSSSAGANPLGPQPGVHPQLSQGVPNAGFHAEGRNAAAASLAAAWPNPLVATASGVSAEFPPGHRAWPPGTQTTADAHFRGLKQSSLPLDGTLQLLPPPLTTLASSESTFKLYPVAVSGQQGSGHYPGPSATELGSLARPPPVVKGAPPLPPSHASFPAGLLPPISVRSSTPHSASSAAAHVRPFHDNPVERLSLEALPEGFLLSPGLGPQHSVGGLASELTCGDDGVLIQDTASVQIREERHQRHRERLQKLMAEWGFKDLATAEAYYRRAQRQQQGRPRRNGQGNHQDFALRRPVPAPQRSEPRQQAGGAEQPGGGSLPAAGLRQRAASKSRVTGCGADLSGSAAVPQRNLNSADGVLIGSCEHPTGGALTRSGSAPRSAGRQILAPLGAVCAIKQPNKAAVAAHRPHHLPALASNNWVATNPESEMLLGTLEGKSALQAGGHAAFRSSPPVVIARPGTVQSVDSSPEVIML